MSFILIWFETGGFMFCQPGFLSISQVKNQLKKSSALSTKRLKARTVAKRRTEFLSRL